MNEKEKRDKILAKILGVLTIFGLIFALIFISLSVASFASSAIAGTTNATTADIAYIYNKKFKIDNNVISAFNDLGLGVDKIKYADISKTDFSKYKAIYVGDEKFPDPKKIPINRYPAIVSNYNHGAVWGITDSDGVSKNVASKPLSVNIGGREVPVYTQAFYRTGSSVAIPYYYINYRNIAPAFEEVARSVGVSNGNDGPVIAYADEGSRLSNNLYANGKICYYGIIKSNYWTTQAKQMFKDCAGFVASGCASDSECAVDGFGEDYCSGKSIYHDFTNNSCINPGKVNASCISSSAGCVAYGELSC